jgi:hypothetical protein
MGWGYRPQLSAPIVVRQSKSNHHKHTMPEQKGVQVLRILPREILDDVLEYLSAKDLRNLLDTSPLFTALVSTHLRRLLYKLHSAAVDDLLCYLISRGLLSHVSFVLRHVRTDDPAPELPKPSPCHHRKAVRDFVASLPIEEQQILAFQLRLRLQPRATRILAGVVAAKSRRAACLDEVLNHPLRFAFCATLCAAALQDMGEPVITSPYCTFWRREVAVEWFVGEYHTASVGVGKREVIDETAKSDDLVGMVLAAPSLPVSVKRVLICYGAEARHSIFPLLDLRQHFDRGAAEVLRKVLRTLREDDGSFPEFSVGILTKGFERALRRACRFYKEYLRSKRAWRADLCVIDTWLEECLDLLLERSATRKVETVPDSRRSQWKPLVQAGNPCRVWALFFKEEPWSDTG